MPELSTIFIKITAHLLCYLVAAPTGSETLSQDNQTVRFNVDCTLAATHYQKNEGLFAESGGGEGGGGSCPSVSPLPSSSCEGSVDTCWSPGQPDGDCPNFGLCCFDGCSNTCPQGQSENKLLVLKNFRHNKVDHH